MNQSPWNSLELAKLLVSLLTPIAVVCIGFFIQHNLAEQNRSWQAQQRIVERRLQVYDTIRLQLNRIFCFIEDVGSWKTDNPEKVIDYKRSVDQAMHSQRAVWRPDTFKAYLAYIDGAAFEIYGGGVGTDAKIKTHDKEKVVGIPGWNVDWGKRLTGQRDPNHKEKYDQLLNLISRDLALSEKASP